MRQKFSLTATVKDDGDSQVFTAALYFSNDPPAKIIVYNTHSHCIYDLFLRVIFELPVLRGLSHDGLRKSDLDHRRHGGSTRRTPGQVDAVAYERFDDCPQASEPCPDR